MTTPVLTIRRVRNGFVVMPDPNVIGDTTMVAVDVHLLSDAVKAWADDREPFVPYPGPRVLPLDGTIETGGQNEQAPEVADPA